MCCLLVLNLVSSTLQHTICSTTDKTSTYRPAASPVQFTVCGAPNLSLWNFAPFQGLHYYYFVPFQDLPAVSLPLLPKPPWERRAPRQLTTSWSALACLEVEEEEEEEVNIPFFLSSDTIGGPRASAVEPRPVIDLL